LSKIDVLDKGYVRLVDTLGDDLRVVNAARVSYDKASTNFEDRDAKLLSFLMREGHTSVLRHAALTFEGYVPLIVARQWYKHAVGSTYLEDQNGWNESSRRYVTEDEQFYLPGEGDWRSKPANSKQGSGETLDPEVGFHWTEYLKSYQAQGEKLYQRAMEVGIAPEQARLFLAANGLYVRFYWTVSLAGLIHFLNLRADSHAQWEIQEFARALRTLAEPHFPNTFAAIGAINEEV
jgi:thymidylate synthase (FAD)